jgi:hypothetical protein
MRLASYISALTPPVAMLVSALFEGKSWGVLALGGVALVLRGPGAADARPYREWAQDAR